MADPLAEFLRQTLWGEQLPIEQLRVEIRDHRRGAERLARLRDDAGCAALLDENFAHRTTNMKLHAASGGTSGHRLGDRSHSTYGVSPNALLAVHFAKDMMQKYVRRSRRVRACVVAHDAVEAVQRLDRSALEPSLEVFAGRGGEQTQEISARLHP